ncbi:CAP domain-containing protein [Nocardioides pacificus]
MFPIKQLGTTLALTAATLLVPTAPTAQAAQSRAIAPDRYEGQAVSASNAQRQRQGRKRLATNRCLARQADRHALRMARQRRIFHQDLYRVMRVCRLRSSGENVAAGFPNGVAVVNRGWMRSAGHRENLLSPRHRLVGIGAVKRNGRWYVAQVLGARA